MYNCAMRNGNLILELGRGKILFIDKIYKIIIHVHTYNYKIFFFYLLLYS